MRSVAWSFIRGGGGMGDIIDKLNVKKITLLVLILSIVVMGVSEHISRRAGKVPPLSISIFPAVIPFFWPISGGNPHSFLFIHMQWKIDMFKYFFTFIGEGVGEFGNTKSLWRQCLNSMRKKNTENWLFDLYVKDYFIALGSCSLTLYLFFFLMQHWAIKI